MLAQAVWQRGTHCAVGNKVGWLAMGGWNPRLRDSWSSPVQTAEALPSMIHAQQKEPAQLTGTLLLDHTLSYKLKHFSYPGTSLQTCNDLQAFTKDSKPLIPTSSQMEELPPSI